MEKLLNIGLANIFLTMTPKTQETKEKNRASLVTQWLRVCLPIQGAQVRVLVWEDSHMPRSNWAREPQLLSLRIWSLCSATREAALVGGPHTTMKSGPHLPQLEKALTQG